MAWHCMRLTIISLEDLFLLKNRVSCCIRKIGGMGEVDDVWDNWMQNIIELHSMVT